MPGALGTTQRRVGQLHGHNGMHCGNHQMQRTPSEPSATPPPPPSTRCPRTPQGRGLRPARLEVPATGPCQELVEGLGLGSIDEGYQSQTMKSGAKGARRAFRFKMVKNRFIKSQTRDDFSRPPSLHYYLKCHFCLFLKFEVWCRPPVNAGGI